MKKYLAAAIGLFGWLANPPGAHAQDAGGAGCLVPNDRFVIWNFSDTTKALISADVIRREMEGLMGRVFDEEANVRAPAAELAKLPLATVATPVERHRIEQLAERLHRSAAVECNDQTERKRVTEGADATELVVRRITLGIVGSEESISHYVLPYKGGHAGKLPFKSCFTDAKMNLNDYLTRLSAHQMAAVSLYELNRVHQQRDWCRLGATRIFLNRAITLLSPPKSDEERLLMAELEASRKRLQRDLSSTFGKEDPGAEELLVKCGVSPAAARIVLGQAGP